MTISISFYSTYFKKLRQLSQKLCLIALFYFSSLIGYELTFQGVSDPELLELIYSVSQLEKLKETPPATTIGLKRRVEGDLTNIAEALHSKAYYDAKINYHVNSSHVVLTIDPGPVYPFANFRIVYIKEGKSLDEGCDIPLEDLKIELGTPALPEKILDAEDILLDKLNLSGYAFAKIEKRDVFADQTAHTVSVVLYVSKGPLAYFGSAQISGLERTHKAFFKKKIRWLKGSIYDPLLIEKTQEALELSGLFRSVNITHGESVTENNEVPIKIDVVEAKQRTVGLGLNYTTILGPGLTGEWEDRNVRGLGHKLSLRADLWNSLQEAKISYIVPDFRRHDQNLIWLAEYEHEEVKAFTETSFSLSATIEKKLNKQTLISYGIMYKLLRSQDSDNNRTFDLIKFPLQLRWSNADSLLNPTKGYTINLKVIPSFQVLEPIFAYSINTLTTTAYRSLTGNDRCVFAAKLMLGSILGASEHDIPPPERFYAGSINTLRGYKYLTVSPLGHDHKPIGGRSMMIYSMELRCRLGENFGISPFYEIGNVYSTPYPQLNYPQLQSVGVGFSYYTPVGPLRCDIAFPLNRRRHLDGPVQIYFNIGQSF